MLQQISQDEFLQRNGRLWMTADKLGSKLGFADGGKSISKLYSRNKDDFEPFKGVVNLTTTGGEQSFLCFDEQGCYIAAMLARTDQAREFRRALARFLAEMREKHETVAVQYLQMRTAVAQMRLEKFSGYHNLRERDIVRIKNIRPWLSASELARLYNLTSSVMEKLLRLIRHADGDFTDKRPKQLIIKGGSHE